MAICRSAILVACASSVMAASMTSGVAAITFTGILSRVPPPCCLSVIAFQTLSAAALLADVASRWRKTSGQSAKDSEAGSFSSTTTTAASGGVKARGIPESQGMGRGALGLGPGELVDVLEMVGRGRHRLSIVAPRLVVVLGLQGGVTQGAVELRVHLLPGARKAIVCQRGGLLPFG